MSVPCNYISGPVEFKVEGDIIRGTRYVPIDIGSPVPVVVMAHGWSMVAGGDLEDYAQSVAGRGLAVLTFDFRNLGLSEGMPRQEIDPHRQIEDIRSAITYARTWKEVDPARVGVWGTSYSGGHALVVSAVDKRVKCVVAQVPTISGHEASLRKSSSQERRQQQELLLGDREDRFNGEPPGVIQTIMEDPNSPAAYPQKESFLYMSSEAERCPSWRNEVTLRSLELARYYEPGRYVKRISPTPLLMIVADEDELTPTDMQLETFNQAFEPKDLLVVKGGHYSVYREHLKATSKAAASWFASHL